MLHQLARRDHRAERLLRKLRARLAVMALTGATVALAACEQVGESVFAVENQTSHDLTVTAMEPGAGEQTVQISQGVVVDVFNDVDTTPPPPETLSSLRADITVDGQPVSVYTQDPVDSRFWQRRVWPAICDVSACARYVLVLTDGDLTLP